MSPPHPGVRTLGDVLRTRTLRSGPSAAMYERVAEDGGRASWRAISYDVFLQRIQRRPHLDGAGLESGRSRRGAGPDAG